MHCLLTWGGSAEGLNDSSARSERAFKRIKCVRIYHLLEALLTLYILPLDRQTLQKFQCRVAYLWVSISHRANELEGPAWLQTSTCRITVRRCPISQRCTCKQRCYWRNSSVAHLLMAAETVSHANICHQTTEPRNEIATVATQDLRWDSRCGNQDSQRPISAGLWFLRRLHCGRLITYACKNLQSALLLGAPRTVSR